MADHMPDARTRSTSARSLATHPRSGVLLLSAVLLAAVVGAILRFGPVVPAVATVVLVAAIAFYLRPTASIVVWMASACFVPFWAGFYVVGYVPPTTLIGLLAGVPLFLRRVPKLSYLDYLVVALALLVVVAAIGFSIREQDISSFFYQWVGPYIVGRLFGANVGTNFVYGSIAVFFGAVSFGSIIEAGRSYNPYSSWTSSNELFTIWGPEQTRAGLVRVEWAFGHSISLGICVALSVAFTLAWRAKLWMKISCCALATTAVVLTFSRAAIATLVLVLVFAILFSPRRSLTNSARALLSLTFVAGGVVVYYQVASLFEAATVEATRSAEYRLSLFDLVYSMEPLGGPGIAPTALSAATETVEGSSLDNTFLYTGLVYGYIPALVLFVGVLLAAFSGIRFRLVPGLAVGACLPALMTVAPITQLSAFLFLVLGLLAGSLPVRQQGDDGAKIGDSSTGVRSRVKRLDDSEKPGSVVEAV